MYSEDADAGAVVSAYEAYYKDNPFVKNEHTQYYKRWLRSIAREQGTSGKTPADARYVARRSKNSSINRAPSETWSSIGPFDWDHEAADRSYAPGAAHVYTVEQSISDPDILYAGTATAGLWRSDNRGADWFCVTNDMMVNGLSALEINHLDADVVYAELLSGIYKTTNGGTTWYPTGDGAFQAIGLGTADLVMHPTDTQVVWAATNEGLYLTADGGANWVQKLAGDALEIEFHPTDLDTLYVVRRNGDVTEFYRSVNAGATFVQQTNGWPVPDTGQEEHQRRTEIAVSPDDPDLVIALATGSANGGSGLYGIYRSEDAGATWIFHCCGPQPAGPPTEDNPNLMGWSDQGLDDGGQYYYDLALDISPTNADSIFVAGVNLWISDDGGETFVCPAKWSHPHKPGYVHADIHDIHYYPETNELWIGCDGGIFWSVDNGINFTRRINGISGTDFWGFGAGTRDGQVMLGGTYHNGTLLKDNDVYLNGWICTDGGDNYRGFVHPVYDRQAFSDYNIKGLSGDREVNNETRAFNNKPNASYTVGRSSDLLFHPWYLDTWYSGSGTALWVTRDNGFSFEQVHDFSVAVAALDICFEDPDRIYVTTFPDWWDDKSIWKTEDGGETWTDITPPDGQLNGNHWVPFDIAVSATDPDSVWIVRTSMYGGTNMNGAKIFLSTNGGDTWENYTDDLPEDEACTAIAHHKGSAGGVYIGTRRAVYYRNSAMDGWDLLSSGLPATTTSTKLIPHYPSQAIRNGTNRSVWERSLVDAGSPIAQASVDRREKRCLADTVYFFDNSIVADTNATYAWSFPGGTPGSSTERDPAVHYSEPGYYDVSLTVTDGNGSDTRTFENIIKVVDECGVDRIAGKAMQTFGNPDYAVIPDLDVTVDSFTITAWIKPDGYQNAYSGIVMNDGDAAGINFRNSNNTLAYHWPGGSWSWESGLIAPPGEWSHVALVVTPSWVRIYLNGVMSQHNTSPQEVDLTTMKIGSYKGWADRNYQGLIDEVSIFERALTTDEIRSMRHLTREPSTETALIGYYQFNADGSLVYDKANGNDANLNGSAVKVRSRAPVGGGISTMHNIQVEGTYNFGEAGIELVFGSGAVLPNGDVWASKLVPAPDSMDVELLPLHNGHWILNNYGTNQVLQDPLTINLDPVGFVSDSIAQNAELVLVGRDANAELAGWEGVGKTILATPGIEGAIEAIQIYNYTAGQLAALRDSSPFGTPLVAVHEPALTTDTRGGSSLAIDFISAGSRGIKLPVLSDSDFEVLESPEPGMFAYHSGEQTLCVFNGSEWLLVGQSYVDSEVSTENPSGVGITTLSDSSPSALLELPDEGCVLPPSMADSGIEAFEYPREGAIVYRADSNLLVVFDGAQWQKLAGESSGIAVNSDPPSTIVNGIAAGVESKAPGAALHVEADSRGLAIPIGSIALVPSPVEGLLIFDIDLRTLCVYDGTAWRSLTYQ